MGLLSFITGVSRAPELSGDVWFNRDELPLPAREAVASGKPVRFGHEITQPTVVNFWNYECVDCGDLIPTLRSWWHELQQQGLFVVGVHTPTYESESRADNVESAVLRFGMTYPVLSDAGLINWQEWKAVARPQLFLVTEQGLVKKKVGNMERLPQFEATVRQLVGT